MAVNSNSSDFDFFQTGGIYGVHIPFRNAPGFAIPLIRRGVNSNARYIQVTDIHSTIVGFDYLRFPIQSMDSVEYTNISVGSKEVFAVVDPKKRVLIGTQDDLAEEVYGWVDSINDPITQYAFAKFCGNVRLQIRSAAQAFMQIRSTLSSESAALSWFFAAIVEKDIKVALSRSAARPRSLSKRKGYAQGSIDNSSHQILFTNSQFLVDFNDLELTSNLIKEVDRDMLFKNIKEIWINATGRELILSSSDPKRSIRQHPIDPKNRLDSARSDLHGTKRQETRFAKLLIYLLTDQEIGQILMDSYVDRTRFVRQAMDVLRREIVNIDRIDHLELRVSKCIPIIISTSHPRRRGNILSALVDNLGEFKHVYACLREIASNSSDPSILKVRDYVEGRPRD